MGATGNKMGSDDSEPDEISHEDVRVGLRRFFSDLLPSPLPVLVVARPLEERTHPDHEAQQAEYDASNPDVLMRIVRLQSVGAVSEPDHSEKRSNGCFQQHRIEFLSEQTIKYK